MFTKIKNRIASVISDVVNIESIFKDQAIMVVTTTFLPAPDRIDKYTMFKTNHQYNAGGYGNLTDLSDRLFKYKGVYILFGSVTTDKEVNYQFKALSIHRTLVEEFLVELYHHEPTDIYYSKSNSIPGSWYPRDRWLKSPYVSKDIVQKLNTIFEDMVAGVTNSSGGTTTTILLYGPPGTGKSTICRMLAATHTVALQIRKTPAEAVAVYSAPTTVILEDMDRTYLKSCETKVFSDASDLSVFDLTDNLLAMDEIVASDNTVLIITANNPNDLPAVLLRPGRIHHRIKVGYLTPEEFCEFAKQDVNGPIFAEYAKHIDVNTLTASTIHGFSLLKSPDEVLDFVKLNEIELSDTRY